MTNTHTDCQRPLRLRRQGFTLIEILAVLCIIGLLLGIVLGAAQFVIGISRTNRANATAASLKVALNSYWHDRNEWPIPSGLVTNIATGGVLTVSGPDNKDLFDMLRPENNHDRHLLDESALFTIYNGKRMLLSTARRLAGGGSFTYGPIVYVARDGSTRYFSVTYNFDLDTATVSP